MIGTVGVTVVVGADEETRERWLRLLSRVGVVPREAQKPLQALQDLHRELPALVVLDADQALRSPQALDHATGDGVVPVIAITRRSVPAVLPQAIRHGAWLLLPDERSAGDLRTCLEPLLRLCRVPGQSSGISLARRYAQTFHSGGGMRSVEQRVLQAAAADVTVLIQGEPGVGKGIAAQLIHGLSARADGPLLHVKCAALPPDVLSSELFGFERGEGEEASSPRPGRLERADGGTVVLEEIAALPLDLQSTLLHFLEAKEFFRVGGYQPIAADVRIVATTRRDLRALAAAGAFRQSLLDRLELTIHVPPLRERSEEIVPLVEHYLTVFARHFGTPGPSLSESVVALLCAYRWPGNVRELESVIKRCVVLGGDEAHLRRELELRIPVADKGRRTAGAAAHPGAPGLRAIARRAALEAERAAIDHVLDRVEGNRAEAARRLRVSYKTLLNKLREDKPRRQ